MAQVALIVMERSGDWAAALRRQLERSAVRLVETRMLEQCWQRLVEEPNSLAAIELTAENVRPLLAMLLRMRHESPEARAIVMAERKLAAYENLAREAGAIHFVVSPRALGDVAELIRRRSIQLEASAARQTDDLEDPRPAILGNLPWSETF